MLSFCEPLHSKPSTSETKKGGKGKAEGKEGEAVIKPKRLWEKKKKSNLEGNYFKAYSKVMVSEPQRPKMTPTVVPGNRGGG